MHHAEIMPLGPFSLAAARDFAGGFPAGIGGGGTSVTSLVMAFPLEPVAGVGSVGGPAPWAHSAVVELTQAEVDGPVHARAATSGDPEAAISQALRCVSLDQDGREWPVVGNRDPVLGRIGTDLAWLRPVCFYSAYEAATSFVIGQRISRRQSAQIKARLGALAGDDVELDGGARFRAFPRPERLIEVEDVPGLPQGKLVWLRGLAEAALDGRLSTRRLLDLPVDEAIAELRRLPGVGPFTAEGTLLRGCGVVDAMPSDALSSEVLATMYEDELATGLTADEISARWAPYRMWATVLLRVGWGRAQSGRVSYRRR